MPSSNVSFATNPTERTDSNSNLMKHQIRMEIALEAGTERINVAGILRELMKRANSTTAVKVTFADAKGTPVSSQTLPKGQEFATRMSVEKVETGRNNKVVLGLYMTSESNMQTIKTTIGFPWLRQHQIYMRHQRMSFQHGTDLFLIGYLVQEHPNFANLDILESELQSKWFDDDATDLLSANEEDGLPDDTDPNNAEYDNRIASMKAEGLIQAGKLTIPISVERSFVKVIAPGKPNFDTQILSVYVPRKHHVAATFLNDHLILNKGDLSIVPFSISKSDPRHFYQQMKNHAKFLHEHRNTPILSVPTREYYSEKIDIDSAPSSLQYLLASNPNIHRFHYLRVQKKINVSVKAADYAGVCKWLDHHLGKFTYGPHRNVARLANSTTGNPTSNSRASNTVSKYADAFSSSSTDTSSFDPSTIATGRTRGAWNRGPPTELIFEPADEIGFPPLTTPARGPPTNETRMNHGDTNPTIPYAGYGAKAKQPSAVANISTPRTETTVEELIARAVAASEAQMTRQFADIVTRQNKLDKEIASLHAELTSQASKIVEGTIQALSGPSTPFLTKADALELKQQHNDTQTHIRAIQQTLTRIMRHFSTEASRPPAAPDESDTVVSPPRKISRTPSQHHHTPADPTTTLNDSMDWRGGEE